MMNKEELEFANDPHGAIEQSSSSVAWAMVIVVGLLLAAAVLWASFAEIEQITSGEGEVIPSRQVQVVESLNPGIVSEILVNEGDSVNLAQPLLRIDDTGAAARLGEFRKKMIYLNAELSRLRAEVENTLQFAAPQTSSQQVLSAYQDQLAIFNINRLRLNNQASVRQQQLIQKQQNLIETIVNEEKFAASLKLVNRELELTERLFKRKAVPEIELLRLRRVALEMRSDVKILAASRVRLEAEVSEVKTLLTIDKNVFLSEVQARISKINSELSIVEEGLRAAEDRVARAVLRAPVTGIVNRLNVSAIGEVITAGATIAEIVPLGDQLLIEARIRPQDIGFIRPGLPAVIRLSAYDYTKYGTLKGRVERIGADTITDENRETFYQVIVSTNTEGSANYGGRLQIIPGMIASIDVTTGNRTVLDYLLKPIKKISDRAFRDPS